MGDCSEKPIVLVTGFGPFGCHEVNASWVAVQELKKLGLGSDVNLVIEEVPVEYEAVQKVVPRLWKKYSPAVSSNRLDHTKSLNESGAVSYNYELVVHVGVSGIASEITLEQQAHNDGYHRKDVNGQCPATETCVKDCCENTKVSRIDMSKVQDVVNTSETGIAAVVSLDPGRFLCDFIYFTSLNIKDNRAAFIHVPPLDKPYTAEKLAQGLQLAIKAMFQQTKTAE